MFCVHFCPCGTLYFQDGQKKVDKNGHNIHGNSSNFCIKAQEDRRDYFDTPKCAIFIYNLSSNIYVNMLLFGNMTEKRCLAFDTVHNFRVFLCFPPETFLIHKNEPNCHVTYIQLMKQHIPWNE